MPQIHFILLLLPSTTLGHGVESRSRRATPSNAGCILDCSNSAPCSHSLEANKLTQSGQLVDTCHCPINYGGVACDIPLYQCTTDADCPGSANNCLDGLCNNACSAAAVWVQSNFVEYACRKGLTEYCANGEYCTNGGKCTSGYVGPAAETLTDASVLCQCLDNFIGRHCERLNLPPTVVLPPPIYGTTSSSQPTSLRLWSVILGAVGAVLLLIVFITKMRRGHKRRTSETSQEAIINTHDLLLQIPHDDIDEELAAAILSAKAAQQSNRTTGRMSESSRSLPALV